MAHDSNREVPTGVNQCIYKLLSIQAHILGGVTLVASQPPRRDATADMSDNPLVYTSELYIPPIVDL